MQSHSRLQFQGGGALLSHAYYLTRSADEELFRALCRSSICNVIAPRQMGKSSLRTRTERRLKDAGIHCATADLRNPSTADVASASWYRGVAKMIARGLGVASGFDEFWSAGAETPAERWGAFLHHYIPDRIAEPVVIFLDETDSVLSLSFEVDDFFAAIRGVHNARADDPRLERLTFCLLGVLSTGDLLDDPNRTPFNIGESIRLTDFTREEVEPLAGGLRPAGGDAERLLDEVYRWTSGHPYMTQRLCEKLVLREPGESTEADRVATLARELFLERGQSSDENLNYAANRLAARARSAEMLALYRRVRSAQRVPVRGKGSVEEELWLTGMVAEYRDGDEVCLRVRNRIFEDVFDDAWIAEQEAKRELNEPLGRWRKHDRHPDYLLRGAALDKAQSWAKGHELTREENEFLREGLARQARETRRRQALTATIAAMLLVLTVLGGIALHAHRTQDLSRSIANLEQDKANLIAEQASLVAARNQAIADLAPVRTELEAAKREKKQADEQAAAVKEDAAKATAEITKLKAERDRVQEEKTLAERDRDNALTDKQRALADRGRLVAQLEELKVTNAKVEQAWKQAEEAKKRAEAERDTKQLTLEVYQARLASTDKSLKACNARCPPPTPVPMP